MMVDKVMHTDCLIDVVKGRLEIGDVVLSSDVNICLVYQALERKFNVYLHKCLTNLLLLEMNKILKEEPALHAILA